MGSAIPQVVTESSASGAQVIDGSLKFNSGSSNYLNRTFSLGNRQTWTWSCWVKRSSNTQTALLHAGSSNQTVLWFDGNHLEWTYYAGGYGARLRSTALFRDFSAWMHVVFVLDTTQATANSRMRMYVNGVELTDFAARTNPSQNADYNVNNTVAHQIGRNNVAGGYNFNGYLAEINFVDGLALDASYFGYTDGLTNTWRPKKYTGDFNFTFTKEMAGPWNAGFRVGQDSSNTETSITSGNSIATAGNGNMLYIDTNLIGPDYEITFTKTGGANNIDFYDSSNGSSYSVVAAVSGNFVISSETSNRTYSYNRYLRLGGSGGGNVTFSIVGTATGTIRGVNGFYLPMGGNSPIGEDKSGIITVNDGTAWSDYVTITEGNTGTNYNTDASNWFNGDTSSQASLYSGNMVAPYSPTTVVFTPPSAITVSSGLRVYMAIDRGQNISVNGTQTNASVSAGWNDTGFTGTLTSLKLGPTILGASSNPTALEIDGVVLLDGVNGNGWTPVNFGGSNSVEKATGALPILNTDGGGNVARPGIRTDSYAANLVLALPLVGGSSDVSNSVNSGSTTKTITAVGGAAASSAQSNFYGGSFVYDGSGDALKTTSSGLAPGTSDFCCEGWFYYNALPSSSAYRLLGNVNTVANTTDWQLIHQTNGTLTLWTGSGSSGYGSIGTAPLKAGCWNHIAYVRDGATHKLYVNGVQMTTTVTRTGHDLTFNGLDIGGRNDGAECINGYVQDVRYYIGTTKYTSNFIPASTSPDILPDTPSGVSGGSKLAKVTDGAVSFDGTNDYLNAGDSSDYAFGTGDFTIEAFVYHTYSAQQQTYFADVFGNSAGVYFAKREASNNNVLLIYYSDVIVTGATPLTENRWYHVAVSRSGSTIRVFLNGVLDGSASDSTNLTSTEYYIGESPSSSSGEMFGFISNFRVVKGTALYTSSFTPPTRTLTNVTNTKLLCCQSQTSVHITAVIPGTFSNDGTTWSSTVSGAVAGSPYDATKMFDGNLATYTDHNAQNSTITWTRTLTSVTSLRVYIHQGNSTGTVTTVGGNGTQVDTISTDFGPGWHNITLGTTGSTINSIAFTRGGSGNPLSIHAVEVNGTALIDGFIGKPVLKSGDAAATTLNPFTTDINAVRGQETGYNTLNPLAKASITLSNGNLDLTHSGSNGNWQLVLSTIGMSSGKFYCEFLCQDADSVIGIAKGTHVIANDKYVGNDPNGWGYNGQNGQKLNNSSGSSYGSSYTAGDVIGIAFDADNGTLSFYKNNIDQGQAFTGLTDEYYFAFSIRDTGYTHSVNFGQKPFKYAPPAGFQPLNDANVRPVKVITRPDQFVSATLYSGNTSTQSINVGLNPDFVWIKKRSGSADHYLYDTVRGATNRIYSNTTDAESTSSTALTAFTSNGFNLGNANDVNQSSNTYVSWAWKAGGNKGTWNKNGEDVGSLINAGLNYGDTAKLNGASVGTRQGFSIVKWTQDGGGAGSQIAHGLTQAPNFVIMKHLNATSNWFVTHTSLSAATKVLYLNDNTAEDTSNDFGNTFPGATYTTTNTTGVDGREVIMYSWHDVPGLQKFGKYTGNNNADGPFIELGFRPALLWIKSASAGSSNWLAVDGTRSPHNIADEFLRLNTSGAETDSDYVDLLSNGFKVRANPNGLNSSNDTTVIYCAWAEAPTVNLFGAQSNAR